MRWMAAMLWLWLWVVGIYLLALLPGGQETSGAPQKVRHQKNEISTTKFRDLDACLCCFESVASCEGEVYRSCATVLETVDHHHGSGLTKPLRRSWRQPPFPSLSSVTSHIATHYFQARPPDPLQGPTALSATSHIPFHCHAHPNTSEARRRSASSRNATMPQCQPCH